MANRNDSRNNRRNKDDIEDQLVAVNRITKVVKGGRRMRFAALVVVGDKKGRVGFGTGKAQEVEIEEELIIPDEDIEMVANQAGVSKNEAEQALIDTNGDLAEAILKLNQ